MPQKNYSFFIYERPGFQIAAAMLDEKKILLKAPLLQISSTQIRKMISDKKSIRYLVPDIVMEEIKNQQYYNSK